MNAASQWSAYRLAEFLAAVSDHTDEAGVIRCAVELASEALEAEAGAIVWNDAVAVAVGFPSGQVPCGAILAAASQPQAVLDVPGAGPCRVVTLPLGIRSSDGTLMIARSGEGFGAEEVSMLRAMARVVSLTLRQVRNALASVQERRDTLKQLSTIQRAISLRAPLQEVLDAITLGAASVLGDDFVIFYGVDPDDPDALLPRSSFGSVPTLAREVRAGEGAVGRAAIENRLVVIENYPLSPEARVDAIESGVQAAMAAPVHEHGQVVGGLVVGSRIAGRVYTPTEQELLLAFSENASLAVTDARTVDALHAAVDDALHQALHDPLTGLANRARFVDRFDHALTVRRRAEVEIAVLYLDVDDFKLINDRFGHPTGDRLLIEVGRRICGVVRSGDTVARLGGDEFAVLLENASGVADAERTAIRILEAIGKPIELAGTEVSATVSIGLAMAGSGSAGSNEVLRNADVAMYRAKNAGKACAVVFEAAMYESLLERLELESDLRRAIENGELEVYFQPIVDLATEQVVGVEALSRWRHPERGFVPPTTFIPLAEETGLIVELGRGVLKRACSWISDWQHAHPDDPPFYVSVNVSACQLQQPELTTEVGLVLAGSMAPGSLVLEITESVLMQDTETTLSRLQELKSLGVRLALDDFGTGYSSLSYLRRFPVDLL
ncbi:MAG TPA: EAL domain-containing protein, partial [Acidimicrobiales bacterium]|nr:EAL domain-containing protein [Acidimicrobiales bacterium]